MPTGARQLYQLKIAELVWYIVNTIGWTLMPRASDSRMFDYWLRGNAFIWFGFAVATLVLLIPFAEGRRGGASESAARAAMVVAGVVVAIDLITLVPSLGGPELLPMSLESPFGRAFLGTRTLAGFAVDAFLWLAIVRSLSADNGRTPAFFGVIAAFTTLSLLSVVLPQETYRQLFFLHSYGTVLRWLRTGLSLASMLLMISALAQLMREGSSASPVAAGAPASPPRRSAASDILVGALFLGGGLVITIGSYSAASSGGGRYVVTTGAIAFGLVRLVRGLMRLGSE